MTEHITPEYEFRWIEDGDILLVKVINLSTQDNAKRFYDILDDYARTWPEGKPYLILFDSMQAISNAWTSYIRQRAEQSHALIPAHATGRTASASPPNLILRFVKGFVELTLNRKNPRVKTHLFYTYDEALNWLKNWFDK